MPYKRKKGGQSLIDMARKARKAKESRTGGKRYVTPAKAKVTKHKGTTTTYKPKSSPQLKPKVRKYTAKEEAQYKERYDKTARKADPAFSRGGSTPGAGLKKRLTTIREKARKRPPTKNEQRRKNLRSEIEGRMKPDDVGRLAKLYGKATGKEMTHRDEAALAGHIAAEGLGLMVGGPIIKGGLKAGKVAYKAAKPVGKAAFKAGKKVAGKAVKAGTRVAKTARTKVVNVAKSARTGAVKAAKTGAAKARTSISQLKALAKAADKALLRAQKLVRGKGGKITKATKKKAVKKKPAKKKPALTTAQGYAQQEINRRAASRAAARRLGK